MKIWNFMNGSMKMVYRASFHVTQIYKTPLVLERHVRTCSLHQDFGYDYDREYVHSAPVRRDQFANLGNMKAGTYSMLLLLSISPLFAEEQTSTESMPSIDFLEFLGEWETEQGEWIDPIEIDDEDFDQLLETTLESKSDNEN